MASPAIPPAYTLLWPTLQAIRAIGGSGTIEEIVEKVIAPPHLAPVEAHVRVEHGQMLGVRLAVRGLGLADQTSGWAHRGEERCLMTGGKVAVHWFYG